MAIERDTATRVGDGLVEKVTDAVHYAKESADLVVMDMVGRGSIADLLRADGVAVVGAGRALDLLELDRARTHDIFQSLGLAVPPTEVFDDGDFDRAMRFVEKHPGKWVFKPSGNLAADKTFVAEDTDEMHEYLEHAAEEMKGDASGRPPFLLQAFVEGAEVSTEQWFANGRPVPALSNQTLEAKKLMPGPGPGLGPAVGCSGNAVFPPDAFLVNDTVAKLNRFAAEHRVCGPIDLNAIIGKRGRPMILEATARFGYSALWAFLARWRMPIGETLDALAHGDIPHVSLTPGVGAAIRVAVPPYPSGDASTARGTPVVDDILDDPMIYPGDVMRDEDTGRLVIAGSDAVAYEVAATGPSADRAYAACYDWLSDSRLPDRMYRYDLIQFTATRLAKLREVGVTLRA